MKKDKELLFSAVKSRWPTRKVNQVHSLQEKTGASAKQIRQAIEIVGFDREKVELYLGQHK